MKVTNSFIGLRFGRWVVIKQVDDYMQPNARKRKQWLCRCDCGTEKKVSEDSLKRGISKSCGCTKADTARKTGIKNKIDLTGMNFGLLTIVGDDGTRYFYNSGNEVLWKCTCACGNTIHVRGIELKSGRVKSCGCAKVEIANKRLNMLHDKNIYNGVQMPLITRNKPIRSNKSGITGVSFNARTERWHASIQCRSKKYYLGSYVNFEDAVKTRKKAEEELFQPIIEKYQERKFD